MAHTYKTTYMAYIQAEQEVPEYTVISLDYRQNILITLCKLRTIFTVKLF